MADKRLKKASVFPTILCVTVGAVVTKDKDNLLRIVDCRPRLIVKVPLGNDIKLFHIDHLLFYVLKELLKKSPQIAQLIGTRSIIYHRAVEKQSVVLSSQAILSSSGLQDIISDAKRSWADITQPNKTVASIVISFGQSQSSSDCVNIQYLKSLGARCNIEWDSDGELGSDYDSADEIEIVAVSQNYSQYEHEEPKIAVSAKEAAALSREVFPRATRLIFGLQSNDHVSNRYYHSITQAIEANWIKYLLNDSRGKRALQSILDPAFFDTGQVTLPADFEPDFESPLWKNLFSNPSFQPGVRGSFPLTVNGKYQTPSEPVNQVRSSSSAFDDRLLSWLESRNGGAKSSRRDSVRNILFSRGTIMNVPVKISLDKSILWHLQQIESIDEETYLELAEEPAEPENHDIFFSIPLLNKNAGEMEISLFRASSLKVSELIDDESVELPVRVIIKVRRKPAEVFIRRRTFLS